MSSDKLVMMANQIGTFFVAQNKDKAPTEIAEHLKKFWDPRMRAGIIAHLEKGGAGLLPEVRRAVESLKPKVTEEKPDSAGPSIALPAGSAPKSAGPSSGLRAIVKAVFRR
jgi:formate dehydrogenase subunit delta